MELRHSEIVRDLTAQLANDRETWSAMTTKLEQRIKQLETDDAKLRQECAAMATDNSALESEQIQLQKQITDLLEENIRLNNEIVVVGDRQRNDDCEQVERENEELLELIERIGQLQIENANLRDKNDELVSELEEKSIEMVRLRGGIKKSASLRLSEVLSDASEVDAAAAAGNSAATKRRGDSPSKAKISEESPKLGKLRKCNNDGGGGDADDVDSAENSGDWMALNTEVALNTELAASSSVCGTGNRTMTTATSSSGFSQESSSLNDAKDEEIKHLKQRIVELESKNVQRTNVSEGATSDASSSSSSLMQQNQELEASLEQMRKEFEDLEDYWQGKLTEERQLFDAEQQKSNGKFEDLLKKMAEYEEQFIVGMDRNNGGRLSPIEEKFNLEQQYADLEAETEVLRTQAREMLEQKSLEIDELQIKLKRLQHRVLETSECQTTAAAVPSSSHSVRAFDGGVESPASSPISYLWQQSTIQEPARDYHNPAYNSQQSQQQQQQNECENLNVETIVEKPISPIQRPASPASSHHQQQQNLRRDNSDTSSVRSFGTHSVASTHSM